MKKGIDISKWNGDISLQQAKNEGIEFVIIRGSYTSNGSNRVCHTDPLFLRYYYECKKLDIPCGVYHYSCAKNAADGKREAKFLYDTCLKGRKFEYPIYIDMEDKHSVNAGAKNATDAVIAFCEYLEDLGYYVGVYASKSFYQFNLQPERLKAYTLWLACWQNTKPSFNYKYHIWQYSATGKIGNITVDRNKCYINNFPDIMKKNHLNGF